MVTLIKAGNHRPATLADDFSARRRAAGVANFNVKNFWND
jgi:hypothetical protein